MHTHTSIACIALSLNFNIEKNYAVNEFGKGIIILFKIVNILALAVVGIVLFPTWRRQTLNQEPSAGKAGAQPLGCGLSMYPSQDYPSSFLIQGEGEAMQQ